MEAEGALTKKMKNIVTFMYWDMQALMSSWNLYLKKSLNCTLLTIIPWKD